MADGLLKDLPRDLPTFVKRFGSDAKCRAYLVRALWPEGFRCGGCGHGEAWSHKKRLIEECAACGRQHSILAGTIFAQTKTGLAKWFLAIWLVTSSKGGISALSALPTSLRGIGRSPMELQRQMGFGSYGTAWAWLHKIRRAMARPERTPLNARVEADETLVGGAHSGKPGRGAEGKAVVVGAVEAAPGKGVRRRLGRLRLAAVPDASAESLNGFLGRNVATPAAIGTDGWQGYAGLGKDGYVHEPINLAASPRGSADPRRFANGSTEGRCGDAVLRLPAIHLVFGLAKRWLLGTHHGAVRPKHLQAYLDDYVFRFNRRAAKSISHGFARLIEHAVLTPPTTYHAISHGSPA